MKALKVLLNTTLFAASLFSAAALQAQDYEYIGNITIGGAAYFADSDRGIDDDIGFFFGGEMPLANRWSLDGNAYIIDSDVKFVSGDANVNFYRLGLNYHLNMLNDWQPYVGFGFGSLDVDKTGSVNDMDEGTFDVGFGMKRFINDRWMLRGDFKFVNGFDSHVWDEAVSVGVSYAFGRRSTPAARPVAATPTPAPAVAERDSDGDGVVDSRDKCPDTPRNLAVDADGCPILDINQRRQELLVNFDFDRSEVKPQYDAEIAEFAEFMQTYGNTNAVIEGHTDSVGTEEYNQGLSERRANAVRNELVNEHNIPAGRVSTVGYGESRPVDTNSTDAGRANNRRIEAVISVEIEEQRRR